MWCQWRLPSSNVKIQWVFAYMIISPGLCGVGERWEQVLRSVPRVSSRSVASRAREREREREERGTEWRAEIAVRRESGSAVSTDWRLQVLPELVYPPIHWAQLNSYLLPLIASLRLLKLSLIKSHTTQNFTSLLTWTCEQLWWV